MEAFRGWLLVMLLIQVLNVLCLVGLLVCYLGIKQTVNTELHEQKTFITDRINAFLEVFKKSRR